MSPVTFLKDQPDRFEGLAIPFGGPLAGKDLDGETFTKDTDLCLPWFGESGRPQLYAHGKDPRTKAEVVGRQTGLDLRDDGYWIQGELDKSSRYRAAIGKLIDAGALSLSSGAMQHLVVTGKDGRIERWPWVETSFTPTPSNALATVYAVKSADLIDHMAAANITIPDPLAAALKALDEWATLRDDLPAGSSYADESDRLLDALKAFAERTQGLADLRAKEGRTLSAANRDRIAAVASALDAMQVTAADMRELLSATDPQAGKRLADAALAEWEYLSMNLPRL